ncbi:acyltransferase family protein [Streptomyces sp. NBC_01451]|uniref:acyltransferase family protein n=1 Tax=Streptomyces sp. NBC_01451 TaxID=2903872 RepID=UPI002E30A202|nr:acyltransferase [Streptomyces sp. NBC_01451]
MELPPRPQGVPPPAPGGGPPAAAAATQTAPTAFRRSGRNLYLDFLRALALVRVVTYHTFNWAWLTLAFPAMGVMFALAGSLMARSLDRGDRSAFAVVRARMRRLLPPVWLFGLVVVAAMLLTGWRPDEGGGPKAAGWARTVYWIVPVGEPPFADTDWARQIVEPLWYIRAYLLFVVLSPSLLRVFRRMPRTSTAAFLALAALAQSGLLPLPARVAEPFTDLSVFGACWLLGFAHRDKLVLGLPAVRVWAVSAVVMAAGGWYALTHRTEEGYDLGSIPVSQALWSFGFVLLLLRFGPRSDHWVTRHRPVHAAVVLLNARAVTVYLWHEVALVLGVVLIDRMWQVPALENSLPLGATWFLYLVAWPLIALAVLLVGWSEDRAAKRPVRLWPRPVRQTQGAKGDRPRSARDN